MTLSEYRQNEAPYIGDSGGNTTVMSRNNSNINLDRAPLPNTNRSSLDCKLLDLRATKSITKLNTQLKDLNLNQIKQVLPKKIKELSLLNQTGRYTGEDIRSFDSSEIQ